MQTLVTVCYSSINLALRGYLNKKVTIVFFQKYSKLQMESSRYLLLLFADASLHKTARPFVLAYLTNE